MIYNEFVKKEKIFIITFGRQGGRTVVQFGPKYDYRRRRVIPSNDSVPEQLQNKIIPVAEKLASVPKGYFNQVIVNHYLKGQGISPHTDLHVFGEYIVCFTIGTPGNMVFKCNKKASTKIKVAAGSTYVMNGAARSLFTHQMTPLKLAGPRYSITLRHF